MEGHKDDDDINPSNDEELPPGSSTKEPKTSFTTAEVQELGQALGISQLHSSLEKISTFLEVHRQKNLKQASPQLRCKS